MLLVKQVIPLHGILELSFVVLVLLMPPVRRNRPRAIQRGQLLGHMMVHWTLTPSQAVRCCRRASAQLLHLRFSTSTPRHEHILAFGGFRVKRWEHGAEGISSTFRGGFVSYPSGTLCVGGLFNGIIWNVSYFAKFNLMKYVQNSC